MTETRVEDVIAALREGTKLPGHPQFTDEARRLATDYARERKASGVKMEEVAAELRMNKWTLQRWLQRQGRGEFEKKAGATKAGFSRVKVKERTAAEAGARLVVHGAHGVRVEGLTLENVAALLERLGCSA
jgi:hypothetical protein